MPTIEVRGPLFSPGASSIVQRGLETMVQALVEAGEQKLDEMLQPRPGGVYLSVAQAKKGQASMGNYARNVHGARKGLLGKLTDGNVLYGPWLEGTGSRNQTTRFKGYASFRRTGQWLEKEAPRIIHPWATKLAKDLGG